MLKFRKLFAFSFSLFLVSGCYELSNDDKKLQDIIAENQLTGDAFAGKNIPDINTPKAQLGMRLFYSKSLGADRDTACASCHHPALGGGDNLPLSIGVGADRPDLLGPGRLHDSSAHDYDSGPTVPRNAPTTFNIAGWNKSIFHDGRIETIDSSNSSKHIMRTPDSTIGTEDSLASSNFAAAQSRFSITSPEEMKGFNHNDKNRQDIRVYLASRFGNYGEGAGELVDPDYWLSQFQTALESPLGTAEELITEQNIAELIGVYELSQVFNNTPWKKYIEGDKNALSESAKIGAVLFYRPIAEGGAGCASCHSGDFFTDEKFHNIAMPQIGRGKGDGEDKTNDFGRFRETKNEIDKFAFRTPSLINVEVTGPWSHAGAYTSLEAVVKHHLNPALAIRNYDYSQLSQLGIQHLDKIEANAEPALNKLDADRAAGLNVLENADLNETQVSQLVEFLKALTDPCVKDSACLAPWKLDEIEDPNGDQLNAVDINNTIL